MYTRPYCPLEGYEQLFFDLLTSASKMEHLAALTALHRQVNDADFMQRLAHTLLHPHSLAVKQYYELPGRDIVFCYALRRLVKHIVLEMLSADKFTV